MKLLCPTWNVQRQGERPLCVLGEVREQRETSEQGQREMMKCFHLGSFKRASVGHN